MRRFRQCEPVRSAELQRAPDEVHLLPCHRLVIPHGWIVAATQGAGGVTDLVAGPVALDQPSAVPPDLHPTGAGRRWSQLGEQVLRRIRFESDQRFVLAQPQLLGGQPAHRQRLRVPDRPGHTLAPCALCRCDSSVQLVQASSELLVSLHLNGPRMTGLRLSTRPRRQLLLVQHPGGSANGLQLLQLRKAIRGSLPEQAERSRDALPQPVAWSRPDSPLASRAEVSLLKASIACCGLTAPAASNTPRTLGSANRSPRLRALHLISPSTNRQSVS